MTQWRREIINDLRVTDESEGTYDSVQQQLERLLNYMLSRLIIITCYSNQSYLEYLSLEC